jgi:hypothetical protein
MYNNYFQIILTVQKFNFIKIFFFLANLVLDGWAGVAERYFCGMIFFFVIPKNSLIFAVVIKNKEDDPNIITKQY